MNIIDTPVYFRFIEFHIWIFRPPIVQIYLIGYEHYLYKSENGGASWKKVLLPDMVKDELIFHEDEKYKDHVLVITSNNKVSEACVCHVWCWQLWGCHLRLTVSEFWGVRSRGMGEGSGEGALPESVCPCVGTWLLRLSLLLALVCPAVSNGRYWGRQAHRQVL